MITTVGKFVIFLGRLYQFHVQHPPKMIGLFKMYTRALKMVVMETTANLCSLCYPYP